MPLGCFVIDLGGYIVDVNPKALEILGSPSAEATKQINVFSYQPLVDQGVSEIVKRVILGEPKITNDIIYTSRWNKTTAIRFTVTPILDDTNNVCLVIVMMEDLTEYNSLKSELERNNKMLKTVIDSLPSLIWLKDEQGKYLFTNRAFDEFNSFLETDVIGKTDYEIWPQDQADKFTKEDVFVQGEYALEKVDAIIHPTLGSKHYRTMKIGICDKDQNLVGTVGVSCDVSRQYEQDQILAEALEALTASLDGNVYVK
jgi:PAS domain S-box-containing protein